MEHETKKELSAYRFESAAECIAAAKVLFSIEIYKGAVNRAYYAVFNAMRSVLALDGIDRKRHSGVISEFRRLYIRTAIFDESLSDTISEAFRLRVGGDYEDYYVISKDEVADLITDAEVFVQAVKEYLATV